MNLRRQQGVLHPAWPNQEPIIPTSQLWGSTNMTGEEHLGYWLPTCFPIPCHTGVEREEEGESRDTLPNDLKPLDLSLVLPTGMVGWS
jgi:hypothetical protein